MNHKNILILGGMGPQASLLLHKKIIEGAIALGARQASDFPAITHLSMPHQDFISNINQKSTALSTIKQYLYCLWRNRIFTCCYCVQHRAFAYA